MARAGRPASESYQPVCCSVGQSLSYSSTAAIEKVEDEGDHMPIFSLSKSSMDVVMATGPPHKRDPAWTGIDLRRSSSANTHTEQIRFTLQQQHPGGRQQAGSLQSSLAFQSLGAQSPSGLNERRIANTPRWSRCSGSTHSRSSTPDTIVWRGASSRPCSLTQELHCSSAPDSPMSKLASPPTTPSPFISPLMTPTSGSEDPLTLSPRQLDDAAAASPPTSPQQAQTASPPQADSNHLLLPSSTDDEAFLENNVLAFQFPSPVPSSVSLQEAASSDTGCFLDSLIDEVKSAEGVQSPEAGESRSPEQLDSSNMSNSVAEEQESDREAFVCHLELPWQPVQSCPAGQSWRPQLVSSLSDSRLRESCRCNCNPREAITKVDVSREEQTMTTQREVADASVQTMSPVGSWWDLRRNTSNMGSHSILGSPPGSRLNLKSSVGSNSNLVSPSSSMFPISDGEEEEEEKQADDPRWDVNSASSHDLERRRSCLKIQGEEREEMGRRSSMKQVQWDEDGMTWDVHGASVDPVVLSSAIRKHLALQNSPKPPERSSKKKKAPQPPIISNVVKATVPKPESPVMIVTSMCTADSESKAPPEADGGIEVEEEARGKTEEPVEVAPGTARAEGSTAKEEEDEEVCGEEGSSHFKSPSRGSGNSRKKSVIRSLRRPGWCVSSRKADD